MIMVVPTCLEQHRPEEQDKDNSGLQGSGFCHSPLRLRDLGQLPQSHASPSALSSAQTPHHPQHSLE